MEQMRFLRVGLDQQKKPQRRFYGPLQLGQVALGPQVLYTMEYIEVPLQMRASTFAQDPGWDLWLDTYHGMVRCGIEDGHAGCMSYMDG